MKIKNTSMILSQKQIADKLSQAVVGIAGLGGLGSNLAVALVRAGVTKLILVDYDQVEASNLNRQYYFLQDIGKFKAHALAATLQSINPLVVLKVLPEKISAENALEIFASADFLAECFDEALDKTILTRLFMSQMASQNKKMVVASGMAGCGPIEDIKRRSINSTLTIVGDEKSDIAEVQGMLSSRVITTAMYQCQTIIEWILER